MSEPILSSPDAQLRIPELASRARLRRNLVLVGLLLVAGAAFAYYQRPAPPQDLFRSVAVSRRTVVQWVEAAGRMDVRRRFDVPAPLSGRLLAIHVREGDRVEAGQKLATLDQRASELAVRGMEAGAQAAAGSYAEAKVALSAAERSLERAKSLAGRGFGSADDVARADSDLERARAVLESARAEQRVAAEQVAAAKLEKSLGHIDAPVAGVILRAPERVGAAVSPEQGPLFVIGDPLETMRVDATVSETDVPFVKTGMTAQVMIVALPGRTFPARVERVGIEPTQAEGAVLYSVRFAVDNPDATLLPGMSARVRIEVARQEDVLAVHEAALRFMPDGTDEAAEPRSRVWRRLGLDRMEPVSVHPGISDGTFTSLVGKDALKVGDELVVGYSRVDGTDRGPAVKLGGKK